MVLVVLAFCSAVFYLLCEVRLWIGIKRLGRCSSTRLYPVSIIIAMKNEMENARTCLEAVMNQNYPQSLLEIIIVDDGSTDETPRILAEYKKKCSFLKILKNESTPENWSQKKFAMSRGIAQSTGEILLFTDADCVPSSGWVRAIVACFEPAVGLVAGFSPLFDATNSLFGKIMLLDSLASSIVAAGSIGLGRAITCTGRNLAYRREVYDQVDGFEKIRERVSGDDDLFLQLVYKMTTWKIAFATTSESVVPCYQTKNLTALVTQKRRHLSAGKYYLFAVQVMYFLFHVSNLFLIAFFVCSIIFEQNVVIAIVLLFLKFLSDYILLAMGSRTFHTKGIMRYLPLWEIFFWGSNVLIGPASWIGKIKWK